MTNASLRPALAALTFVAALWCAPDAGASGMRAADAWGGARMLAAVPPAVARPAPAVGDIVATPLCEGFHLDNSLDASGVAPGRPLWLSRDPLGEAGGLNLYGFVGNDPVNKVDYLGMVEVPLSKDIVPLLAATSGQETLEKVFVKELFGAGIDPSRGADRAKLESVFSGFESFWGSGGYETAFIDRLKDVYGGALLGVHDARMAAFDARPRTSTNPLSGEYFAHKMGVFKTAAIGAAEDTIDFGLEFVTWKSAISTIADGQTTRFTFSGLEYENASEFDEAIAYASFFLALTPVGLVDDASRAVGAGARSSLVFRRAVYANSRRSAYVETISPEHVFKQLRAAKLLPDDVAVRRISNSELDDLIRAGGDPDMISAHIGRDGLNRPTLTPDGKVDIVLYPHALQSTDEAVMAIGHELRHLSQIRAGINPNLPASELQAIAAESPFLKAFLRAKQLNRSR